MRGGADGALSRRPGDGSRWWPARPFGAICGSSVATAATITQVALPELEAPRLLGPAGHRHAGPGGTLGILIPPSVPLVIYAILTEQNIAKLFAAADGLRG